MIRFSASLSDMRTHRRAARVVITIVFVVLSFDIAGTAEAATLPPPPCTAATERGGVPTSEFLYQFDTPEGHFTIYYGLDTQRTEDLTGLCFPNLFGKNSAQYFVENVGALLEQVYSFYAGAYATSAFAGLGFDMPSHLNVKLYNADSSVTNSSTIRLKVKHVYALKAGEYRFLTHTILHEMIHSIQFHSGAPGGAPSPLLDWFWEGQARYANWFLGSKDDGSGNFLTYFGPTPTLTSFWDLSQTLEHGSYHFGGRLWRFLTYNWPVAGISEADRDAATHLITLPHDTGVGSIYRLRPQRGIYLLQEVMEAVAASVSAGTCPVGDECFRTAVDTAFAARVGNYTYDKAYRAYAAENVMLEGPSGGDPLFQRFRGKFRSWGWVRKPAADQSVIRTYAFETSGAGDHHTVLITGSADNGSQNGTGDDDDLRFELDKGAFGGWNTSDAFDGNSLHGLTVTRFLRTSNLASSLPEGSHTLTVYGDETPAIKQVRVVRGDIQPVVSDEWIPQTYYGGTAPGCDSGYAFHTGYEFGASPTTPLMMLVSSALRPQDVKRTVFKVNGDTWQYDPPAGETVTYSSDAPQVLQGDKSAGIPVTLRTELPDVAGTMALDVCTMSVGATELHTIDSLYVYPRPTYDVFVEIDGHLHEYSTQYEVFMVDPEAAEVEITLEGTTSGRFLNVIGEFAAGGRVLLSGDVWQPSQTPQFSYTLTTPGLLYKRLIVGVGTYGFEAYDSDLEDITERSARRYTLRIVTRYDTPSGGQIRRFLPAVERDS